MANRIRRGIACQWWRGKDHCCSVAEYKLFDKEFRRLIMLSERAGCKWGLAEEYVCSEHWAEIERIL